MGEWTTPGLWELSSVFAGDFWSTPPSMPVRHAVPCGGVQCLRVAPTFAFFLSSRKEPLDGQPPFELEWRGVRGSFWAPKGVARRWMDTSRHGVVLVRWAGLFHRLVPPSFSIVWFSRHGGVLRVSGCSSLRRAGCKFADVISSVSMAALRSSLVIAARGH